MDEVKKLPEKFYDVIKNEGVVSIISWSNEEPHVANTWNSYLEITEDQRILIPAYGLRKTQRNVGINNKIKLTLGTRNVLGYKDYPGTGFYIEGTAKYLTEGIDYDYMKEKYSFLSRVLEVTVTSIKQTL